MESFYIVQVYDNGKTTPITIKASSYDEAIDRVQRGLAQGRVLSVIKKKEPN